VSGFSVAEIDSFIAPVTENSTVKLVVKRSGKTFTNILINNIITNNTVVNQ